MAKTRSMSDVLELGRIPSAPESELTRAVADELPDAAPAAPWNSRVDALLWFHAAPSHAGNLLPRSLAARVGMPITIGGLISYRSGPVGPYGEIFGTPVMLRGGLSRTHVAFMAVDSPISLVGGRRNWALPKVLARFAADPGRPGRVTARGDGWALSVTIAARTRRVPIWSAFTCAQVWPDGQVRDFRVRMRGRARLASVEVEHTGASGLGSWLRSGRHPAVLISGNQNVSPPRG